MDGIGGAATCGGVTLGEVPPNLAEGKKHCMSMLVAMAPTHQHRCGCLANNQDTSCGWPLR